MIYKQPLNILALDKIKTKKADKSEVLSYLKVQEIIRNCEETKGNIYAKAANLMKDTIKKHAFASGNRRTAFIITKYFLTTNNIDFNIPDTAEYAKIMTGIRENYYTDEEIKNWIQHGTIREFKRH